MRWPRRRSLPPGWRPPGRARGAAGCWARWISSPAGPLRPRTGCWRRGRPTIGPGTRPWARRPPPSWRCCAWSRAGSRRRSNGVSGRRRPAPPRPPCATGPWACWRSPCSADGRGPRGSGPAGVPARRPLRGAAGGHRHARAAGHGQGLGRGPGRGDRRPFHRGGKAARRCPAAPRQPVPELPGGRRVPPRILGRRRGARRAGRLARPGRRPGVGPRLRAQRRRCRSRAARRLGGGQRARPDGHRGRPGLRRPGGDHARPPSPGRSWPWPGAIWRASPTPPRPCAPRAGRRS